MMTTSRSGYQLRNLCFSYGSGHGLHDISLTIEPGYFFGLIGPNGSGKSTLLDLMSRYLRATSGTVSLNGIDVNDYSSRTLAGLITAVPQSFTLNFDYSVYDVVMMGRHPHIDRFAGPGDVDFAQVERALQLMGLTEYAHRLVRELSGGEKQRVMIARALAQNSAYIILDEVTSNLDISHGVSIMKTMASLVREEGRTVIAALHDLNMMLAFCDRVVVLKEGRLYRHGTIPDVMEEKLITDLYQVGAELSQIGDRQPFIRYRYH